MLTCNVIQDGGFLFTRVQSFRFFMINNCGGTNKLKFYNSLAGIQMHICGRLRQHFVFMACIHGRTCVSLFLWKPHRINAASETVIVTCSCDSDSDCMNQNQNNLRVFSERYIKLQICMFGISDAGITGNSPARWEGDALRTVSALLNKKWSCI